MTPDLIPTPERVQEEIDRTDERRRLLRRLYKLACQTHGEPMTPGELRTDPPATTKMIPKRDIQAG